METKPPSSELTPLELRRKIAVKEAARLNGISEATFRRHFGHLVKKITTRRDGVELSDAINLPPPPAHKPKRAGPSHVKD
jgi:hypothetical protein